MAIKRKKAGLGLEMRTFNGQQGSYIVFRTSDGSFHTFLEVQAKEAARDCGAQKEASTRQMWEALWKQE